MRTLGARSLLEIDGGTSRAKRAPTVSRCGYVPASAATAARDREAQAVGPICDGVIVSAMIHRTRPSDQLCDLVLDEQGTLTVVIAGDWLSREHVDLLRSIGEDIAGFSGPRSINLERAGLLAPEAWTTLAQIA